MVLNFANWDDELALASRLGSDALGHATTVHPLLCELRPAGLGAGRAGQPARSEGRALGRAQRSPRARYGWTIFKPDRDALAALDVGVRDRRLSLPVGLQRAASTTPIAAFAHVPPANPAARCCCRDTTR